MSHQRTHEDLWCTSTHDTFHICTLTDICIYIYILYLIWYEIVVCFLDVQDTLQKQPWKWCAYWGEWWLSSTRQQSVGWVFWFLASDRWWVVRKSAHKDIQARSDSVASLEFEPWVNQFKVKSWDNFCKAHRLLRAFHPPRQPVLSCYPALSSLSFITNTMGDVPWTRCPADVFPAGQPHALNRGESEEDQNQRNSSGASWIRIDAFGQWISLNYVMKVMLSKKKWSKYFWPKPSHEDFTPRIHADSDLYICQFTS